MKSSLAKHSRQTQVPLNMKICIGKETMLLRYVYYFSLIADLFPHSLPNRTACRFSF